MSPKHTRTKPDFDGLPTTDHMDRLVAAYESMAGELKCIREILDRCLQDFQWALNNDKLTPECFHNISPLVSDPLARKSRDFESIEDGPETDESQQTREKDLFDSGA